MIKYMTLILLLALGCVLLIGCGDPAVQLAQARYNVKRIDEKSQRKTEIHQQQIAKLESRTDLERIIKESKVKLTGDFGLGGASIPNANYKAADALLNKVNPKLPKDSPVLVASFVDIDALNNSSTFGRVVAEQFASRFKQRNYATIEMKLRTNVFIREGTGELLLSREVAAISDKHRAQAVVVGTYAVASKKVYLTVRVINVNDGHVLSSYDYDIPITSDVFKMLLKGKGKSSWL